MTVARVECIFRCGGLAENLHIRMIYNTSEPTIQNSAAKISVLLRPGISCVKSVQRSEYIRTDQHAGDRG